MKESFEVCVCASGGGGNFQAVLDHRQRIGYSVNKLIADRECGAIGRAVEHGIPYARLDRKSLGDRFFDCFEREIPAGTDLIVLAGFMPILPPGICQRWDGRIINTHPSLLPKYGGIGMYGVRVQEAVIESGDEYAGCSVHFVTEEVDRGEVILQAKVKTVPGESAWDLGGRVFIEENRLLPRAIEVLMTGRR